MSKLIAVAVVLLLGLAGGGAGVYYWLDRHGPGENHPETQAAASHEGHDEHAGGEAHAEHEDSVKLSEEAIREFGIEIAEAAGGAVETVLTLPGEIVLNADRVAHIVPRVSGVIREVKKTVGDTVKAGEILAVLESRELAEAKTADLSAEARLRLAEKSLKRVEDLWKQKISSEQQYQEAVHAVEEARIVHRETMAKLHALGLAHDQVSADLDKDDTNLSRHELKAPFAATVVDRHAALGEVHDSNSDVFVLADLSTVWVDITIYPQDAARILVGSKVRVWASGPDGQKVKADGTIAYISPLIRESTRTGLARAVITNDKGLWRPGLFVTAEIITGQNQAAVLVPNDAVQTVENQTVVFVAEDDKFEKRVVVLDQSSETHSGVKSGLKPGERYIAKGAFVLKAELSKGTGEHEH